jgi:hypothetical protein
MVQFLILLLSLNSYALTFSHVRSGSEGQGGKSFTWEQDGSLHLVKTSNLFDVRSDYKLGKFSTTSEAKEIRELILKTKAILKSKENRAPGHQRVFMIDDSVVLPSSPEYPKLEEVFKQLDALQWVFEEGSELDLKSEKLNIYSKRKLMKKVAYPLGLYCVAKACAIKDGGVLYVP